MIISERTIVSVSGTKLVQEILQLGLFFHVINRDTQFAVCVLFLRQAWTTGGFAVRKMLYNKSK